jgi:hypothetical protein
VSTSLPVLAGSVSTAIFIASTLPMLVKAARTKDLASYSLGNILLANIGNLTYAGYVLSLPLGPVWALHGFHLCATGLMLFWYLRHAGRRRRATKSMSTFSPAVPRDVPMQGSTRGRLDACVAKRTRGGLLQNWRRRQSSTPYCRNSR